MKSSPACPPVPQDFLSSLASDSRKPGLLGSPSITVTFFPEERFSSRSFAVIFGGTVSAGREREEEQRQSFAGHPHVMHRGPASVEYTRRLSAVLFFIS